jgi:hypothetical protein
MKTFRPVTAIAASLRALGPYAAIGLVVPGGSLIALAMWAYTHRAQTTRYLSRVLVSVLALAAALLFPRGA